MLNIGGNGGGTFRMINSVEEVREMGRQAAQNIMKTLKEPDEN